MSESLSLSASFGEGLQSLINKAVGEKLKELDAREAAVKERERRMKEVFENEISVEKVILRVGSRKYVMHPSVLLSRKDTYFTGLLSPEVKKPSSETKEFVIPRDGDVFAYVFEYLTYGKLLSDLTPVTREKLMIDADYYLLPELKEQALKAKSPIEFKSDIKNAMRPCLQVNSSSGATSGAYWNWNVVKINTPLGFFTISGNTITVVYSGIYQVNVRVSNQSNTNGECSSLYVNGTETARSYTTASGAGFYATATINEILSLSAGATLQVYNNSRGTPVNDHCCNSLNILRIE